MSTALRFAVRTLSLAAAVVIVPTAVASLFAFASGWRVHDVVTDSMAPALPVGAVVVTKPVRASAVRTGDVISFSTEGGTLVVHRVVKIVTSDRGPLFVTQGDANDGVDRDPVRAPQLRGTLVSSVPGGGVVLRALFSDQARVLYVVVPALLLAVHRRTGAKPQRGRGPSTESVPSPPRTMVSV